MPVRDLVRLTGWRTEKAPLSYRQLRKQVRDKPGLSNNDFVGAQQTQNFACLLVQQIKIQIVV